MRWLHENHDQILFVIFVKNVKETSIGASVLNNTNFGESDVYRVDKDLELKEFRIDSNGEESLKSPTSLKKLEIKRLPPSDGELVKKQCKKATRVCNLNSFSGSLWKLDGYMLQNKAKIWLSDEFTNSWVFKTKTNLIYIENIVSKKVLGTTNDGKVIPEDYKEGKAQQLWKKGEPNAEGYFTLKNSKEAKIMTAISSSILQIKGNTTLEWIVN